MSRFGKGWNTTTAPKSPRHRMGLGHPKHLENVTVPYVAEVVLPPFLNQFQTSTCTGNSSALAMQEAMTRPSGIGDSVAAATALAMAARANPPAWAELPSRLFLYFNARYVEGATDVDDGAVISDIFDEAALMGVPPESAWAFSDDIQKITAQPEPSAYRRAADQRILKGAWRLMTKGSALADDVKSAIATGSSVVWGTELDQAFEDLQPGQVWPGVRHAIIGGHAMVLHKYEGDVFWTRSSWGDWCEAGSARISVDAVMSEHAEDFWVVATVPFYSEVTG